MSLISLVSFQVITTLHMFCELFLLADYWTASLLLINLPTEDQGQLDPDEISSPASPLTP